MKTKYLITIDHGFGEEELLIFHNLDDVEYYLVERDYDVMHLSTEICRVTKNGIKIDISVKKVKMFE